MNTNSDFTAEIRNSALWSGDSRMIASGKANKVILTKLGQLPIPDLSHLENVRMGHVMEPVIGRLAQERLGIELTKVHEGLAHPRHPWMRSHFDFVGSKGGKIVLVEAKNYNAGVRSKFDENGLMPAPDLAQLTHECAVFNTDEIYLAVLFGGQEFVLIPRTIGDAEKDQLIKSLAEVWGHIQAGTTMPPEDVEQCKLLYPSSIQGIKTASGAVEEACWQLSIIKANIKALEAQEGTLQTLIQGYMAESDTLSTIEGQVLATWKSAKATSKFDAKRFELAMPDIYRQFCADVPGSRRFLLK